MDLGLDETQEKAYNSLLAFGQLSFGEFCMYNNFSPEEGNSTINVLSEKGLVAQVKGLSDRYIPRFPFLNISEKFKEPVDKFKTLTGELDNFFKEKENEVKSSQEEKIKEVTDAIDPKIQELETTSNTIKTEVDTKKLEFDKTISDTEIDFKTKLDEIYAESLKDFNSKKDNTVSTAFTGYTEKKEKTLQDSTNLKESLSKHNAVFFEHLDASVQTEIEKMIESVVQSINSFKNEIEKFSQDYQSQGANFVDKSLDESLKSIQSVKELFLESITSTKSLIEQERTALGLLDLEAEDLSQFDSINIAIKQPLTDLRTALLQSKQSVDSLKEEFSSNVSTFSESDSTAINETLEKSKSEVESLGTKFKEAVSILSEQFQNNVTSTIDAQKLKSEEILSSNKSVLNQNNDKTKELISTSKSNVETTVSHASSQLDASHQKITSELTPKLDSNVENWKSEWSSTIGKLKESSEKQSSDLIALLTQTLEELKSKIESNKNEHLQLLQTANEKVDEDISNLKTLLQNHLNETKALLDSHKQSVLTELPTGVLQTIDNLNESLETQFNSLVASLDEFKKEWDISAGAFSTEWVSLQNDHSTRQLGEVETHSNELNTTLDAFKTRIQELRETYTSSANSLNEKHSSNLNEMITASTSHLMKGFDSVVTAQGMELDKISEEHETKYQTSVANVTNTYTSVKDNLGTFVENLNKALNQIVSDNNSSIETTSATAKAKYDEHKANLQSNFSSSTEDTFKALDETNSAFYDEVLFLQNTLLNDISGLITNFQSGISDLTQNQMKAIISSLQVKFSYVVDVQNILTENINGFVSLEQDVRQHMTSGIDEQAKLLQTNIKDHVGEIEKLVKVGEELLTPSSTILDEFDNIIKNYDYPKVISGSIIGWAASMQQMKSMMGKMKSRVTLLIPNPADIPLEEISQIKRPKRIDLSCQFDLGKSEHKTFAKRLLDQDNVTLRNIAIRAGGTDSEFPPFLAVDIDGEEVMFGTQDPSNATQFVGMVSQNEQFVQLMGKVVLSDFLSRAKKMSPGDV